MKKLITLAAAILMFCSCSDTEGLNKDPKHSSKSSGEAIFNAAQKALVDQMVNPDSRLTSFMFLDQYWAQVQYLDASIYSFRTVTSERAWERLFVNLFNLKKAKDAIQKAPLPVANRKEATAIRDNKLQVIEIMNVYAWSALVDIYGDIPYSRAEDSKSPAGGLHSEALDPDNPTPKFDDAEKIYEDLLSRLNAAISKLDQSKESFEKGCDNIYGGDVAKWLKFANSLKLRMAITLADAQPVLSKEAAEQAAAGVFTSSTDNASLKYLGASPNANPTYENLVANGRHDYVPTSLLIDKMKSLKDPRLKYYFDQLQSEKDSGKVKTEVYKGGIFGVKNAYADFTSFNGAILEPTYPGTILSYVEVEFLLAEAAARGYSVVRTAESYYKEAIKASIQDWHSKTSEELKKDFGKKTFETFLANKEYEAYIKGEKVRYESGNWKKSIGIQAWIALYNRGFASWLFLRRLDYPKLESPKGAKKLATSVDEVPVRYRYPTEIQKLNTDNWSEASKKIGGDKLDTKIFWDKN